MSGSSSTVVDPIAIEPVAVDPIALNEALRTDIAAWQPVVHRAELDSTNDELRQTARSLPALHGSWLLAVADAQRKGRGRMGRAWFSLPRRSLMLSVAAELTLPAAVWPRASLVVGAAVCDALRELTGLQVGLKWPNDLLVQREGRWRKLGGILCERDDSGRRAPLWIAGIGINVAIDEGELPPVLADHACALSWFMTPPALTELAAAVALSVRRGVEGWQRAGGELDVGDLRDRMLFFGAPVELDVGVHQPIVQTLLRDIDATGDLIVSDLDGANVRTIQPLSILSAGGDVPWSAATPPPPSPPQAQRSGD